MKRATMFALAAALAFAVAAPAAAEPYPGVSENARRAVTTADIDTNQARDAETLLQRFRGAARTVCGDRPGLRPIAEKIAVRACMREAIADAVAETGDARLAALYHQREGSMTMASR